MRIISRKFSIVLAAVFAMSVVGATAAGAAEGPFYRVAGARLKAGESKEVKAKAREKYVMSTAGSTITCRNQALVANSKIVGSTGATAGTGEETIEFTECTVEGNGYECEIANGKIATNALKSELGYAIKERTGKILVLLKPVSGSTFATIKFAGSGCKTLEMPLEGSVAAEASSGHNAVEVGKEPVEAIANEMRFPRQSIKTAWVEKEGKLGEKKLGMKVFSVAFTIDGLSELTLVAEPKWGVYTK
jgi:hypothetical protein